MHRIQGTGRLAQRLVAPRADSLVRSILACKWSLTVFDLLRREIRRPGAMVDSVEDLSDQVSQRLPTSTGRVQPRRAPGLSEVPPRVEYHLTERGFEVADIFDRVVALDVPPGRAVSE